MATLERAIEIAALAHKGQVDKAGAPYILHPLRLMMKLESEVGRTVAVMHDVLEDSCWTPAQLRSEGFSDQIIEAIECLTRRKGESFEDYIHRAGANAIARKVKIADLEDNMNLCRIGEVARKDLRRVRKYHQAWRVLTGRRT
jgi:(p)ppGpp synthase/HD superfamily hydrolase